MNYLILCEGETDAILLGYFLIRKYGWEVNKHSVKGLTPNVDSEKGESVNWYKRNGDNLLICGVGGCSRFSSFIDEYIVPIQVMDYQDDKSFSKIIVIQDRDNNEICEIETDLNSKINKMPIVFKSNVWYLNSYNAGFGKTAYFNTYLLVVPLNGPGALENVVLQALSENDYDKNIVDDVCTFVDNIKVRANKYLCSDRYVLKAKLGVTFAVISPMKVFQFLDGLLRGIEWENKQIIVNQFAVLKDL